MEDARLAELMEESMSIPVHSDTRSPAGELVLVRREMQRRHPELSEAPLETLTTPVCCCPTLNRSGGVADGSQLGATGRVTERIGVALLGGDC